MTKRQRARKRRQKQTALFLILFLGAATIVTIVFFSSHPTGEIPDNTDSNKTEGTTDTASEENSTDTGFPTDTDTETESETTNTEEVRFDPKHWTMVLANYANPLPENWTVDVEKVQGKYEMDVRCAAAMRQMIADAKADGITLQLCSAYRDIDTQKRLFTNKVNEYLNRGYSQEEAEEITATIIAVPGTSEHHTGLAADIVTPSYQNLNAGFDKTDAYAWLSKNCYKYGFVLRYPEDKQDITKIIYEPWHYRYVGLEAAQIIWENGYCLEEFLEIYCN